MSRNNVDWEEIIKKEIDPNVWVNFTEEQRKDFFSEAEQDEKSDSKALVVAMSMWLV